MTSISVKLRSILSKTSLSSINTKLTQFRHASYDSSPFLVDLGDVKTKYQVTQSPDDWKYVERILPPVVVPTPLPKDKYPSEWKPQGENLKHKPYYIARTKNHMMPVYLHIGQHGIRRVTYIRKIQGDIWLLEKELRNFLQPQQIKPIRSQVNEFAGYIRLYGDYVNAIKYWLTQKKL